MNSVGFTHHAAEKKCPSCGEPVNRFGNYLFCEREHGTQTPKFHTFDLPAATRTARVGRFTIAGEEGFWMIPSHMDNELQHAGPPEGAIVASITRYHSKIPTAVVFVRGKKPRKRSIEAETATKPGRPIGAFIKGLASCHDGSGLIRTQIPKGLCLTSDCGRKTEARGVCKSCHTSASILVADRKTTWGELEDYGLVKPKKYHQKKYRRRVTAHKVP